MFTTLHDKKKMDPAKSSLLELGLAEEDILPEDFGNVVKITFMVVYVTLITLAMFGNVIIIINVCAGRPNRTVTHDLLISVSLSYMLVSVLAMTLRIVHGFTDPEWRYDVVLCKIVGYSQPAAIGIPALHVLAISIDRYQRRGHSGTSRQVMAPPCKRLLRMIIIWAIAITVTAPQLFIHRIITVVTKDPDIRLAYVCRESFPSVVVKQIYTAGYCGLLFATPFLLVLISLSLVGCMLNNKTENTTRSREDTRELSQKRETFRLAAGTATLFLVSWLPFFLCQLLEVFYVWKIPRLWREIIIVTGFSSSASHPLILGMINKNIKQTMREVMVKVRAKCGRRRYNMDLAQGVSVLALSPETPSSD